MSDQTLNLAQHGAAVTDDLLSRVQEAVRQGGHRIVAFDADGTLWRNDVGESFFQHQIATNHLNLPPDPWKHYRVMKSAPQGPFAAYLWLAQINQGIPIERVRGWARDHIKAHPPDFIEPLRSLVGHLLRERFEVWIVTASVKWAVEPAAALLGLSFDSVLGVQTKIIDGLVSGEQMGAITWRGGKPEALLAATGARAPCAAFGNTLGDRDLLAVASHLRVAISTAPPDSEMFKPEQDLQNLAQTEGWLRIRS
jgi:phosphoserine phosphatase